MSPMNGQVREDGFIYRNNAWRSPESMLKRQAADRYRNGAISGLYQTANSPATKSDAGEAGELIVAADLLARGYPVTKPINRNGAHDLHFKLGRWFTVQVKLGRVSTRTGTISCQSDKKEIVSDILALVDLPTKRVRYMTNTNEALPKELNTDLETSIRGFEAWQRNPSN